ncbi:dihydrofolate reductase-like domain-containing protein [Calycina marina]|uniref:Dihydrofolate reductase n=1 Tax=Calycina marina TaxID=1763456 RepID=A0A9P8CGN8_9HELO|nr:dihydrofolate reductase-like domain-containing protein [Calycina marina]
MSLPTQNTHSDHSNLMAARELTLIVAATNKMGIGLAGTLPWIGLKKELSYFARVTKRAGPGTINAVVMGRKTWESIPPRFRPLKDRLNVVISSGSTDAEFTISNMETALDFLGSKLVQRKAFVIGGGQMYKASLEHKEAKRILLTRVLGDFECDTFFPIELNEDGTADGWLRKSKQELDEWVGETVPEGIQEENETKYVFEMWERTDSAEAI